MADHDFLPQRILDLYDDMPRGQRRLADVLLEDPAALRELSATELAVRARVSKATTARFFQTLGYSGFRHAQRSARDNKSPGPMARYSSKLAAVPGHRADLSLHLTSDIQNLVRTIEQQRSDELNHAIRALANADKIWVVGFGDNYPLAHFARALLIRIRPDIRMIPIGGFPVPEEFASISARDTMLALGVGRRTRSLLNIMRSAVRAGAQVVFITDQVGRASAEIATVTLRCRTRGSALFDSVTAPVSLLSYLCSAMGTRLGEMAIERLHLIDTIHDDWGDLVADEFQ